MLLSRVLAYERAHHAPLALHPHALAVADDRGCPVDAEHRWQMVHARDLTTLRGPPAKCPKHPPYPQPILGRNQPDACMSGRDEALARRRCQYAA